MRRPSAQGWPRACPSIRDGPGFSEPLLPCLVPDLPDKNLPFILPDRFARRRRDSGHKRRGLRATNRITVSGADDLQRSQRAKDATRLKVLKRGRFETARKSRILATVTVNALHELTACPHFAQRPRLSPEQYSWALRLAFHAPRDGRPRCACRLAPSKHACRATGSASRRSMGVVPDGGLAFYSGLIS